MKVKIHNKKNTWQAGIQLLSLLVFFLSGATQSFAIMTWQPAPAKHKHATHNHRMMTKDYQLTEHSDATVFLWKPDLKSRKLELESNQLSLKSTGMDSYHALVAKRRTDDITEVAIRYPYMRGKPTGISPRVLVGAVKASFEIIPAPLPREHRRYHAAQDAVFLLRYEGKPVSNTSVTLSTSNGTTLHARSDRVGAFRFSLPDDFTATKPGRANNKPAEFVLYSEYSANGRHYRTSLSAPYYVDPAHWQSTELGAVVLIFGFVSGVAITRRGRKRSSAVQGGRS